MPAASGRRAGSISRHWVGQQVGESGGAELMDKGQGQVLHQQAGAPVGGLFQADHRHEMWGRPRSAGRRRSRYRLVHSPHP